MDEQANEERRKYQRDQQVFLRYRFFFHQFTQSNRKNISLCYAGRLFFLGIEIPTKSEIAFLLFP
jgi:hypothetical protein